MATHIMLSFSTQIAQHTEEHPPTPWRVGPCNQVTGGAGMCGGGGVPPTRGLCGAKVFQNMLQALDIKTNGEKRVVWFRTFIDGLTAKLYKHHLHFILVKFCRSRNLMRNNLVLIWADVNIQLNIQLIPGCQL